MAETTSTIVEPRYRLRVKQCLAIVEYAVASGVKPASRRFSLDRKTIRAWRDQWCSARLTSKSVGSPRSSLCNSPHHLLTPCRSSPHRCPIPKEIEQRTSRSLVQALKGKAELRENTLLGRPFCLRGPDAGIRRTGRFPLGLRLLLSVPLPPASEPHACRRGAEEQERRGFGDDLETNRVIAAKADDVAGTIPR